MAASEIGMRAKDGLMVNFKTIAAQVEELLRSLSQGGGDKFSAASARIEQTLTNAKRDLGKAQDLIMDNSKEAVRATDRYVREHPLKSIGIAAGIGLIVGLLLRR